MIDQVKDCFLHLYFLLVEAIKVLLFIVIYLQKQTSVSQSPWDISTLVDESCFAYKENGSEVLMWDHGSQLVAVYEALFVNA